MAAHLVRKTLNGGGGGGKVLRNGCKNLTFRFDNLEKFVCVKEDVQTIPYFEVRNHSIGGGGGNAKTEKWRRLRLGNLTTTPNNRERSEVRMYTTQTRLFSTQNVPNIQDSKKEINTTTNPRPANHKTHNNNLTTPLLNRSEVRSYNNQTRLFSTQNVPNIQESEKKKREMSTTTNPRPANPKTHNNNLTTTLLNRGSEVRMYTTQTRLFSMQNVPNIQESEKKKKREMSTTTNQHTQQNLKTNPQFQSTSTEEENPLPPSPPPPPPHTPVMAEEVVEYLSPANGGVILDMTFGGGGHSRRLLRDLSGVRLVCVDRDPTAHSLALELQKEYPKRVLPILGKFSELPTLLTRVGVRKCFFDGVLMDLGVSSMQFNTPHRGFMLSQDGPLDMRMDGGRDEKQIAAADILSHIDQNSLYKVLKFYGEEKHARLLSEALVESRQLFHRLNTTKELANLVATVMEGGVAGGGGGGGAGTTTTTTRTDKIGRYAHPATKVFQALRILVNNELNEVDYGMRLAYYYLQPGGVLTAISFHSLEDTIVKRHLQGVDVDLTPATIGLGVSKHRTALSTYTREEMECLTAKPWKALSKHVVLPSEEEVDRNPRARSAKMRPAMKL